MIRTLTLCISIVCLVGIHPVETIAQQTDVAASKPLGLILTWQQDPTTTMTIDWHTGPDKEPSWLEYKRVGSDEWNPSTVEVMDFPFSNWKIHRTELTGLEPGSEYRFRIGEHHSAVWKFRTMPDNAYEPIRFAAGGDVRHRIDWMRQTNRRVAAYDPDFIKWGGDLAYADAWEDRVYRWKEFVEVMMTTLVTADGRVIPVLAGIGNHEVKDHSWNRWEEYEQTDEKREEYAPYFYRLFAFPGQPGYAALDFSDYMSILMLDTGHSNPVEGEQTEWLRKALEDRSHIPHLFPNYHIPAFPSVRNPDDEIHVKLREKWVSLFEEFGVRVAFESHDHAYKRTYPIRGGDFSADGIVYIGDGAWGVYTRPIGGGDDPEFWGYHGNDPWYLKRASSQRHFILGTIHGPHQHYLMINEDGIIIDEYPRTPHLDRKLNELAEPRE